MPSNTDRYLSGLDSTRHSLSATDNWLNLKQRETAIPRVTPEDQQPSQEDEINNLLSSFGVRGRQAPDGSKFQAEEPETTFVPEKPTSPLTSFSNYVTEKVFPDLLNNVVGILEMTNIAGAMEATRLGGMHKPQRRVMFEGRKGGLPKPVVTESTPAEDIMGLVDAAEIMWEDPLEFIKNQPVTAALVAFGGVFGARKLIRSTGQLMGARSSIKQLRAGVPKEISKFLVDDVDRVMSGKAAYADVFISKADQREFASQLRNVRKLAKSEGKIVRMVRSGDVDNPGAHVAIFDEKAMDGILKARGIAKKAKNYLPQILDDPQARSTEHVSQILKQGRGDGWVDVGRAADVNFGDFFRSPHLVLQRLHPAGPEMFRSVQGAVMTGRAEALAARAFRDEFYKPIKRRYGKEKLTEVLIDMERQAKDAKATNKSFNLDEALSAYPDDIQKSVKAHSELMKTFRAKRIQEYIASGVPEEEAVRWGTEGPYITRLFQGNYRIFGRPPGGGAEKAMFHGRTMTDGEAFSSIRKLRRQGWTDLRYDHDNTFPLEVVSRLPRKQLERLKALVSKNTGATRDEVNAMFKTAAKGGGEITALAPIEGRKRFDRFAKRTLDEEFGNGEYDFWVGAEKDYERITDAYIDGTTRYISMNKARREFNKFQSQIPSSMKSLRKYNENLLNAVEGRRWHGSEAFDGWMQKGTENINDMLAKQGVKTRVGIKPYALERYMGFVTSFTANAKLGTPRAALVNLTQTAQTLYPRVGSKIFWESWGEASTKAGKQLARDAGVVSTPTKFEGLTTRRGQAPKNLLFAFSKAEEKNRTVSYLAGRRWAKSTEGKKFARETLGLSPDDPDFAHKIGVDMVTTTQFDLSAADMAAVFGRGQNPLVKMLSQFKPFQFKYIEHLAQLRKHPNPVKAYGRAAAGLFATGGVRAMTLPLAPLKMAKYYGMFELYNEIRDTYGETTADVFASGLPGAAHMDLSYSLNVDIFPSFGNTAHEKVLSYFAGPTVASMMEGAKYAGLSDPDWDDAVASLRRLFPQIKMGQNMKKLVENEKWLRDNRGKKLARATGSRVLGRPLDLWMESLSFMTPRRRVAYEARYDLGQRGVAENVALGIQNPIQEMLGIGETKPDKLAKKFTRFAKERE